MSPRLATLLFSRLSELDTKEGPGCNDETDREPQENPDQHHNTCISARVLRFESVCRCLRADRYGGVDGRITRRREAPNDKPYENSGPENPSEFTDNTELSNNVDRENEAKWAARLVGAGSLLTLVYETAFLVLDRRFLSLSDPPVLIFSLHQHRPVPAGGIHGRASGSMDAPSLETGGILMRPKQSRAFGNWVCDGLPAARKRCSSRRL